MQPRRIQIMLRSMRRLWRWRLRSALILSSAAVGVAGVVCPVNYGAGGARQLLDQVRRLGTNVLVITPAQDKSIAGRARTGNPVTTLVKRDHAMIRREVAARVRSSAVVSGNFWVKAGDLSKNAAVVGCEPEYFSIRNWPLAAGGLFDSSQEHMMARVTVLGHTAAADLFGTASPVGRRITINRVPFIVAGVLTERGQGLDISNEDSQVYVPLATAMRRLVNVDHYNSIVVEVGALNDMDGAALQIHSILRRQHHLRGDRSDDFQIQNQKTLLETQNSAANRLGFFLRWIGASALVVSGVGILGITWIAVKERTRELGTCRALGATAADIFFEVWFENMALALVGGLIGLGLSWPASRLISDSAGLPFVYESGTAGLAFAAAAALNVAFSLLPSRKAAHLDPIDALQHE
jgi:putative ABC transport system permease protein